MEAIEIIVALVIAFLIAFGIVAIIHIYNDEIDMTIDERCIDEFLNMSNKLITSSGRCAEYYVNNKSYVLSEYDPQFWSRDSYVLEKKTS